MTRNVESDTNKTYRKKYFMDAEKVVFSARPPPEKQELVYSPILDPSQIEFDQEPLALRSRLQPGARQITVETIKEGDRIRKLRISCPCGQHAEVDVKYSEDK